MEISPRLSLSYVQPQQAQKHVTVNETFRRLDALAQLSVVSRRRTFEPDGPAEGEAFILPHGADGPAWAAMAAGSIAVFQDGAWAEISPKPGWTAFIDDESRLYTYSQGQWRPVGGVAEGEPFKSVYQDWRPGDAAVALVLGQSNAEGAETTPSVGPLANVHMMPTAARAFAPFSTVPQNGLVRNNLFRTLTAARANPATSLALAWQARIDAGEALPDLYIIHCAGGGQGVSARVEQADASRWNPARAKSAGAGAASSEEYRAPADGVEDPDASLFDLARDAARAGVSALFREGLRPRVLGALWLQGEADATHVLSAREYGPGLGQVHAGLKEALATPSLPFFPAYLATQSYVATGEVRAQTDAFLAFAPHSEYVDIRNAPHFDAGAGPDFGVYIDGRHYNAASHDWLAEEFLTKTIGRGMRGFASGWSEAAGPSRTAAFWGGEELGDHYDSDDFRVVRLTPDFDHGGAYDAATGVFTAPHEGVYRFELHYVGTLDRDAPATGGCSARIYRNGDIADFIARSFASDNDANAGKLTLTCAALARLGSGETIAFAISGYQNRGDWTFGGGYRIA